MATDLESRIRHLDDRVRIIQQVTKYAIAVDRRDCEMLAGCFKMVSDPTWS
jgi:hypothetical protein